jgi:hypothetical protein
VGLLLRGNDGDLWSWLGDADSPPGALADTGASGSFIGPKHWLSAVNKQAIPPVVVGTGNGETAVDRCGDLPESGGLVISAPYMQGSPETLLSVGETCYRHGCGYTQDPGNAAARLWHPDYGRDTDVELVKDGVLFRLPEMSADVPWISGERKTAIASLTGAIATAMSAHYLWSEFLL